MAQAYTLAPNVARQLLDDDGAPVIDGKLYTKVTGTNTDSPTYQTPTGTLHANPIELDTAGRIPGSAEIFLAPGVVQDWTLKATVAGVADVTVWFKPGIGSVPGSSVSVEIVAVAGEALSAGDPAYISDGSGGKTTGKLYKTDSANPYSSTRPTVGFIVSDVASGAQATLRTSGQITLTGPLLPGLDYYLSTAGTITTTAPTNARYIGQATSTTELIISSNPTPESVSAWVASVCNFRLTLTTAVPVTTADVTAATTVYCAPYQGNAVGLYTGSAWALFNLAQLSIAIPAVANQMYDVFLNYNSGAPALAVLAWTNDTTRATALTTQDGILVKTGATTQRYLGSFRTTAVAGQTEDSLAKRYVWNNYNRVQRPMRVLEATATWAYSVATWRQANAAATNQLDLVCGWPEDAVDVTLQAASTPDTAATQNINGIGADVTNAPVAGSLYLISSFPAGMLGSYSTRTVTYRTIPAVGRHFYAWLEYSTQPGGNVTTWYGVAATLLQSGISAIWRA